ncbi:MAG: S-layer homology domain-containing protein, partial [Oscillospiraceae bacterium]|nr:S-layer homology domain-containing protein [Oscillospiraceae bacterium]
MSNLKRFLALTLAIVMVIGGMAMNVSAAKITYPDNTDDWEVNDNFGATVDELEDVLDILSQLKIAVGFPDGNFHGVEPVTRAQFALFVARISTGTPEFFVVDENYDPVALWNSFGLWQNGIFTDVDPSRHAAYILAINYCFKEGIVLGRDEESTIFDPDGTIIFSEAVTMLVRALNYTGLTYPNGYMNKANLGGYRLAAGEIPVALIGEWADFNFKDVPLNYEVTRNDMAMLLWNFLMSAKYDTRLVYDVQGMNWQSQAFAKPILGLFGITPIEGYVTGVEANWGADLQIPRQDIIASGNTYVDYVGIPGTASIEDIKDIYGKIEDFWIYSDIRIGYWDYNAGVAAFEDTSMALHGFDTWLADNKEAESVALLGLKVLIFKDNRKVDYKIQIPARVIGTKEEVDISEANGSWDRNARGSYTLSIPFNSEYFTGNITERELNKGAWTQNIHLYRFATRGAWISGFPDVWNNGL